MAKFVDERVETLIPFLTAKIEARLKNEEPVSKSSKIEGVIHQVKCTACSIQPITGIRYKCTVCANFNLCQVCEEKFPHEHNMIKMKFVEEP